MSVIFEPDMPHEQNGWKSYSCARLCEDGLWRSWKWIDGRWIETMTEGDIGIERAWETITWRL